MADLSQLALDRTRVLDSWARFTAERLQKSIKKLRIGVTGSLSYSVIYAAISSNGDTTSLQHSFNYYGKFRDMGVGKGQPIGDYKDNGDVYSLVGGGRKPKKWFSKTYYGQVAELRTLMMEKYAEQSIGLIKETITKTLK